MAEIIWPKYKHALVLSGGGAKGAYQASAAREIIKFYRGTDLEIDLLAGTSVGALNAVGIAAHGPDYVVDLWKRIGKNDVMRDSRVTAAWRFLQDKAVYDSSPLWRTLTHNIDLEALRNSEYKVIVLSTSLDHRTPVVTSNESDYILESVYASASLPGAFKPVDIKGYTFVDGGVITNTPIGSVIEAGCQNITIVLLDYEPVHPREYLDTLPDVNRDPKFDSLREVMSRVAETSIVAQYRRDLNLLTTVNKLVEQGGANGKKKINFQIFKPPSPIGHTLDFDRSTLNEAISRGEVESTIWLAEDAWFYLADTER